MDYLRNWSDKFRLFSISTISPLFLLRVRWADGFSFFIETERLAAMCQAICDYQHSDKLLTERDSSEKAAAPNQHGNLKRNFITMRMAFEDRTFDLQNSKRNRNFVPRVVRLGKKANNGFESRKNQRKIVEVSF